MKGSKKHRNWDSRIPARDAGFVHLVSIPYYGQANSWWNEACIDVLEVFGLPGNRFTSHPKMNQMEFYFKSHRDAELCKILLSDKMHKDTTQDFK